MIYQSQNSLQIDLLQREEGTNLSFPPHLHSSFEWITVTSGEMHITVDETPHTLHEGDSLLIFPNQIHTMETPDRSRHVLYIFSPQLIEAYSKIYLSKLPESNLFRPSPYCLEAVLGLKNDDSLLRIKGVLYLLCAEFDCSATYKEWKSTKNDLLTRVFRFVEEHYRADCSLEALSQELSYHYVYLSKYFKRHTGLSFTDYVNRYRVNEGCRLLQSTDRTVLEIAYECGFESLRNFNRLFKKTMNLTPSEYRANL